MGVLYIVRHGQAPAHAYGPDADIAGGPGLTDLGFVQARAAGRALAAQVPAFDAAFCGDLPRQRATMTGVLESFGNAPTPTIDPDWNEYVTPAVPEAADIHHGGGRAFQDALTRALHEWVSGADTGPESYAAFAARTRAAAERAAAAASSGKNVLVVSSAGVITQLIGRLWEVPAQVWPAMSRAAINTGITKLIVGGRGLTPVSINDHAHLSASDSGLLTFR